MLYKKNNGYPIVVIRPVVSRRSENFRRNGQWADIDYNIIIYHNSPENARALADLVDKSITENQASDLAASGFRPRDQDEITEDYDEVYGSPKEVVTIISMVYPFTYRQKMN